VLASALASQLMSRTGPRPLILAGTAAVAGGMFWFSTLTEHAGYTGQLLGPMLVSSCGLGLVFVPLALVALHNVAEQDSGVASSLLNAAQQVGGAIGLALLGTVAWTTVANSVRTQVAQAAAAAAKAGRPLPKPGTARLRPSTITPWPSAFLGLSWLPQRSGCSPCSSRSPPSGSAARTCPVPVPRRKRGHRNPGQQGLPSRTLGQHGRQHRRPGPCSGSRTEPLSPPRPALAGSARAPLIEGNDHVHHEPPFVPRPQRGHRRRPRLRLRRRGVRPLIKGGKNAP
jgi:hypothetical protein